MAAPNEISQNKAAAQGGDNELAICELREVGEPLVGLAHLWLRLHPAATPSFIKEPAEKSRSASA